MRLQCIKSLIFPVPQKITPRKPERSRNIFPYWLFIGLLGFLINLFRMILEFWLVWHQDFWIKLTVLLISLVVLVFVVASGLVNQALINEKDRLLEATQKREMNSWKFLIGQESPGWRRIPRQASLFESIKNCVNLSVIPRRNC